MILVDRRVGSRDLVSLLRMRQVPAEPADLEYGDACFEGNGEGGPIQIGIERKRLHDMLNCIDDSRYSAHQRVGMNAMYKINFLIIEGEWKPDYGGALLELFHNRTGAAWGKVRPTTLYSKLYRYLISVGLTGVNITYSTDAPHTAQNIVEIYRYFQKRWEDHTSMLQKQTLNIPDLRGKPPLVRRWAAELDSIGVKLSILAEKRFRSPRALATATEEEWMEIEGVGVKKAQSILAEIWGKKHS